LLAPKNERRHSNGVIKRLEPCRVVVIVLRNLAVIGELPDLAGPGFKQPIFKSDWQRSRDGRCEMRCQSGAMDVAGHFRKHALIISHVQGVRRSPRIENHSVSDHDAGGWYLFDQMRAKDSRAAEIMPDEMRPLQFQMVQPLPQYTRKTTQAHFLPLELCRRAITGEVEVVQPILRAEAFDDAPPDECRGPARHLARSPRRHKQSLRPRIGSAPQ